MSKAQYAGRNGTNLSCCCNFGAAVRGEWPEFQCYYCQVHTDRIMAGSSDMCKRHKSEVSPVPKERIRSARQMLEKLADV